MQGRYPEALRSFSLAYLEDVLTHGGELAKGMPAYATLTIFGISDHTLSKLRGVAEEKRTKSEIPLQPEVILDKIIQEDLIVAKELSRDWRTPTSCSVCGGDLTLGYLLPRSFVVLQGPEEKPKIRPEGYRIEELMILFINASTTVFAEREELESKMMDKPLENIKEVRMQELAAFRCDKCGHVDTYASPPRLSWGARR